MKTIAQMLNVKEFPFKLYDENGNKVYFEHSNGFWCKREYDENGKQVYLENSNGYIEDDRVKEMTVAEVAEKLGHQVKIIKG